MGTLSIPTKDWAIWYHHAGWHPLPLPAGSKYPPPEGRTGFEGADMTLEEVEASDWSGNLGVRMPFDVIGLDIDAYHGGLDTFKELLARHGPLPDTWISHSGRDDGSGIRFYRVPSGMSWVTGLPGIEVIQRAHRYACVHPSTHPDRRQYGWWDQAEQSPTEVVPKVEDLPDLPWKWVDALSRAYPQDVHRSSTAADRQGVADFLAAHQDAEAPSYQSVILDWFRARRKSGYSRHDTMQHCLIWAMEMARAAVINAQASVRILGEEWVVVVAPDTRRMKLQDPSRATEFEAMLRHAVGKAAAKPQATIDKLHDDYAGIHMNTSTLKVDEEVLDIEQQGLIDGATFILDTPSDLIARWGKGSDVLWACGESLILCGPTGVGKTTLAGQILAGLIGVQADVLGYPVKPAKRVLYLAMDRPKQIQRALRRRFGSPDRQALSDHLLIRKGPLPATLDKKPHTLVGLATALQAEVVIVDSLKDAALKLSDDESGGMINQAVQLCNAADIDVLIIHHQRKSQEGKKPTTLEDVYGNTQITAGAGSVVLLWGEAGSESVELTHLKQPADTIGPLQIEHDHLAGTSQVTSGWDALTYLQAKGSKGATTSEAAQAHHGSPQTPGSAKWKKTERRLRGLVNDGHATVTTQAQVGQEVRYFAMIQSTPQKPQKPQVSRGQVSTGPIFEGE